MRKSRSELDIHHIPSTHFTSWSGLTNTSNKSPSHSNREKNKNKKLHKPIWKLSHLLQISISLNLSFMGNYISLRASESTGKVILSNGTVHEFNRPLTVAELMLEHPQQVVVEFPPVMNGSKPTPLPADKKLDMKKAYLMLPMKRGKVVLSPDEARRIFYQAKSVLRSGSFLSSSRILPLFARMCPVGIRVGNEVVFHRERGAIVNEPEKSRSLHDLLPEVFDQRPEFLSKQLSGKGWKPALDTITEKKIEKKVPHWLF